MSRRQTPIKQPFESTTQVPETADIAAFRAFAPSTALLSPAVEAQYGQAERDVEEQYGAYSGIPSQVARNRLRDLARAELARSKGLALAEGNTQAQALRLAQLESLASMTRGQKQSGFNSILDPAKGNTTNALISGGSGVAAAAIPLL